MSNLVLLGLMSAGIVQGVFLAGVFLSLQVANKNASRLLAALVFVITIIIASELLDVVDAPFQPNIGMAFELALGPVIYLFARSITDPNFNFDRRVTVHFLPLVFACLLLALLQAVFGGARFTMSNPKAEAFVVTWALAKIPYFFTYAYFADRIFMRAVVTARRWRRSMFVLLRWWFIALYAISALLYLNFILFIAGVEAMPEPDNIGALALVIAIFSVAYIVLANRRLMDGPPPMADSDLAVRVEAYLDDASPFTDPDFTSAQLAAALRADETSVTQALSAQYNGGFKEVVNRKRVEAFDRLIRDPANKERTILDLALEVGFNSKATFYRAFKSVMGATPTAYRTQLAEKREITASQPAK